MLVLVLKAWLGGLWSKRSIFISCKILLPKVILFDMHH